MLGYEVAFKKITRVFIAWCFFAPRGRHVFDFISLTDEGIGVDSPDTLNRAQ